MSADIRILITGGLGFIGARLGYQLLSKGYRVSLGTRKELRLPNKLQSASKVLIPWNNYEALKKICSEMDVVVQAAGMNASSCINNVNSAFEFRGTMVRSLASAAASSKVKLFVYISSAHVYDDPLRGVITENSATRNPHPYARSHLAGEEAVLNECKNTETSAVILRLANSFGAPISDALDCWKLLINDLCKQAVNTRQMKLRGNGKEVRDFLAISEVCRIIEEMIAKRSCLVTNQIFNLGSGLGLTTGTVAEMIKDRCLDIFKYEPTITVSDKSAGLEELFLDYRIDKLKSYNLRVDTERNIHEIDNLLRFCRITNQEGYQ